MLLRRSMATKLQLDPLVSHDDCVIRVRLNYFCIFKLYYHSWSYSKKQICMNESSCSKHDQRRELCDSLVFFFLWSMVYRAHLFKLSSPNGPIVAGSLCKSSRLNNLRGHDDCVLFEYKSRYGKRRTSRLIRLVTLWAYRLYTRLARQPFGRYIRLPTAE